LIRSINRVGDNPRIGIGLRCGGIRVLGLVQWFGFGIDLGFCGDCSDWGGIEWWGGIGGNRGLELMVLVVGIEGGNEGGKGENARLCCMGGLVKKGNGLGTCGQSPRV
jgi:hypothetical protein